MEMTTLDEILTAAESLGATNEQLEEVTFILSEEEEDRWTVYREEK